MTFTKNSAHERNGLTDKKTVGSIRICAASAIVLMGVSGAAYAKKTVVKPSTSSIAVANTKAVTPVSPNPANVPNGIGSGYGQAPTLNKAKNLYSLLTKGKATANFRLNEFTKFYPNYLPPSYETGTAVGGSILYQTGELKGFSGAIEARARHRVDFLSPNLGSGNVYPDYKTNASSITQAYVQYHGHGLNFRAGRQLMSTPFAAPSTYDMLPRAFYGLTATFHPLKWLGAPDPKQLSIFAARITKYESRFSDKFTSGDKYFRNESATGYNGIHGYHDLNGFLTVGADYKSPKDYAGQSLQGRFWYYRFYNVADLFFADGQTTFDSIGTKVHPLIGTQLVDETNSGDSLLGPVNSQFYGLKLGLKYPRGAVSLVGTYAPTHHGVYSEGGLAIPYGRIQNNGGVFTATMNTGNIDLGAGYAYGIKIKQNFLNDNLNLYASYIRMVTSYGVNIPIPRYQTGTTTTGLFGFPDGSTPVRNQHSQTLGFGISFNMAYLSNRLKGLKLQDQFNTQHYRHGPHYYSENRFRIVYNFQ